MDLIVKKDAKEAQLVEINPFGATSGCGSCLFHWLRDAKLLHGLEDHVEIRISTDRVSRVLSWYCGYINCENTKEVTITPGLRLSI